MGSTNHVCFSVGYAWFYGSSLVVGSYALLFFSMATRAAQFAFLALFENPRTSTSCSRVRAPDSFPIYMCRHRTDIRRTQYPCRTQTYPSLRRSIPPTRRCYLTRRCHPMQPPSLAVSSASISGETAIDPDGPRFDRTGGFDSGTLERTPGRTAKQDLLDRYLGRISLCGVTWIGVGASVLPGNATARRYIYIAWNRTSAFQLILLATHTIICALLAPIIIRPKHWGLAPHLTPTSSGRPSTCLGSGCCSRHNLGASVSCAIL